MNGLLCAFSSRLTFWLMVLVVLFAALAYYPSSHTLSQDYDIWFHLAYGRHYVENLTPYIDHSIYSWTPAETDWIYGTWIGTVTLYLWYQLTGVAGLFVFQWAVLMIVAAIFVGFVYKTGGKPNICHLTGLLMAALTIRLLAIYVKPENFSVLFFTMLFFIYYRFRFDLISEEYCSDTKGGDLNSGRRSEDGISVDCRGKNLFDKMLFRSGAGYSRAARRKRARAEKKGRQAQNLIWAYMSWFFTGADTRHYAIWALPLLFALWVNVHGLWFFGIAFLALVSVSELTAYLMTLPGFFSAARKYWCPASAASSAILLKATMYSGLALIINPHGPAYPLRVINSIVFRTGTGAHSYNISYQNMFAHLFHSQGYIFFTVSAWGLTMMIVSFIFLWQASWRKTGRLELPVLVSNLLFYYFAMSLARMVVIYPLLWLFSVHYLGMYSGLEAKRWAPVSFAMTLPLLYLALFIGFRISEKPVWFGKYHENYIPVAEVEYIGENGLPGPLFNDYLSGGYLMWALYPEYRVFIDPRSTPYLGQVFSDYVGIGSRWSLNPEGMREFLDKYPARTALLLLQEERLLQWFVMSPQWALAYIGPAAAVFIHEDALDALPPEAQVLDLCTRKFEKLSDPGQLLRLFNAHVRVAGTREELRGHFIRAAGSIRDIYAENVRSGYVLKKRVLSSMEQSLRALENAY